ncbi:MAG: Crp/Fnr family transcriptional regulator [Cyclobacteriaceae bacterium]|nr:Crp/Fnr family transcriptional regulator [Cyclobacteriaceae bacterium]UYN86067.1 MAG: Crp/Fnr family transcriptional regulator [Cyclobacteriaceae bacterium]
MDTRGIISHISRHVTLSKEEEQFFISLLIPVNLKQGEFIEQAGEITTNFIHVNTGCLMTYFTDPAGHDHVIQFSTSGWWTADLHSLTHQQPSIYSTRALADSEVLLLPKIRLEELVERYPVFERFFRIMFQNSLVTHQHRIVQAFSFTAEQRYDYFQQKYPQLEQFVPLKYIASYLGITPEFLSKIRRKRMEK